MRKNILVIGNFDYKNNILNGQVVRTRTVYQSIEKNTYAKNVRYLDTSQKSFLMAAKMLKAICMAHSIVIMIGEKKIDFILRLLNITNKLTETTYVVIGGWLGDYINEKNNNTIQKNIKKLNGVLVQTKALKKQLEKLGFHNVIYFPNYRRNQIETLSPIKKFELNRVIFFSRLCKEKGATIAIRAIQKLNHELDSPIKLDMFGPIHKEYEDELNALLVEDPNIQYKGMLEEKECVNTIKKYDCMLFPTSYNGEGFPGTILESFMAGVPIVASDWKYNSELIANYETGILCKTYKVDEYVEKLKYFLENPQELRRMGTNCLREADKYNAEKIEGILYDVVFQNGIRYE